MRILLLRDRLRRLPDELWGDIIQLLDFDALCSASQVCKIWNSMATPLKAPRFFKYLHERITLENLGADQFKFAKFASARSAFAALSDSTSQASVYFPLLDRTFDWPLPAPLVSIHSSEGFFCGLVSPAVAGQGFQFIVTSEPVSSSTSWLWKQVPPTEFLRYAGDDHLPRRVRFVSEGGVFYIVVVADDKAEVIEVFSSKQGAWKRHLRPSNCKPSSSGFKGHIAIAVVEDEEGSLLALSFNPESNRWGSRVPLLQPPDAPYQKIPPQMLHTYEYFGYGENMLAATFTVPGPSNPRPSSALIVHEVPKDVIGGARSEYMLKAYPFLWDASASHLINVSTCGNTICCQWFNGALEPQGSLCHLNKYGPFIIVNDTDVRNFTAGFRMELTTKHKIFLLTCCE